MNQQLFYMQQLLGTGGWTWMSVALLVCLFLVLILHPERIQRRSRFKPACWLLVSSVIVPPVLNLLVLLGMTSPSAWSPGPMSPWVVTQGLVAAVGPILVDAGTFFGLTALMPGEPRDATPEPPRHPLESR